MSISFNDIPVTRVPFVYAEFDSSKAQQGPALQKFTALIIGQMLTGNDGVKETLYNISSDEDAINLFGNGSQLTEMIKSFRFANKITTLKAIPLEDGAAVKGTGLIAFTGAATKDGTLSLYVAGKKYSIAITSGDAATDVVTAMAAKINADLAKIVSAVANVADLEFTAINGGLEGNDIDLRFNYYPEDKTPAGLSFVITDMNGGSGSPDIQLAIDVMGETQYKVIIMPYVDTSNLNKMKLELDDRFGPIRQNDGLLFTAKKASYADMSSFGALRNSKLETAIDVVGPVAPFEWAAKYGAVAAKSLEIDPARPLQTLSLPGILAGNDSEVRTWQERNALLYTGIATHTVSDDGTVRIERAISTYQKNDAGAEDTAYLDINSFFTLSFIRFNFRTYFQVKYPRHKLANDGTRFGPGQAIITPKIAKAEIVSLFRDWEEIGLVEGADQFINDLIVERNISDPNRLDVQLSPDLINQLRVMGAQFAYLL